MSEEKFSEKIGDELYAQLQLILWMGATAVVGDYTIYSEPLGNTMVSHNGTVRTFTEMGSALDTVIEELKAESNGGDDDAAEVC